MNTKAAIIDRILANRKETILPEATAFAPANIALCKYWGKRNTELNLPVTDSLSLSLGELGSRCKIAFCENNDTVLLNGEALSPELPFVSRLTRFLDNFRGPEQRHFRVDATNSIPTAAGFASSASGFASLVLALDTLHGWELSERDLSILARLGSGSACRSLWQGFVHWHAGTAPDGMDSFAEPMADIWPDLRIGLIVLNAGKKALGSTEAMRRTVETSLLYSAWPKKVEADMADIRQAIRCRDFEALGAAAESNALAMHATMMAARPPVLYWQAESLDAMQLVWATRNDGIPVYFTMDAGPNLKLLYRDADTFALNKIFPILTPDSNNG